MGFSYRDGDRSSPIFLGNRGQGTIELVLVMVVAVAIIMGGLYQLNTAFKAWANNYFGDYLSCLLETGDLPTIGGSPGDSGICEQFFKPFSFADGRPALSNTKEAAPPEQNKKAPGQRDARKVTRSGGGGGGGGSSGGGRFTARASNQSKNKDKTAKKSSPTYTGSTSTSDSGAGDIHTQRPMKFTSRTKLNNNFAFEEEKQKAQQRRMLASSSKREESGETAPKIKMKPSKMKQKSGTEADTGFTIGNFIKYIIIAAIIIALVMFLGGQALSISKSME